jgi:hypothetical protein
MITAGQQQEQGILLEAKSTDREVLMGSRGAGASSMGDKRRCCCGSRQLNFSP